MTRSLSSRFITCLCRRFIKRRLQSIATAAKHGQRRGSKILMWAHSNWRSSRHAQQLWCNGNDNLSAELKDHKGWFMAGMRNFDGERYWQKNALLICYSYLRQSALRAEGGRTATDVHTIDQHAGHPEGGALLVDEGLLLAHIPTAPWPASGSCRWPTGCSPPRTHTAAGTASPCSGTRRTALRAPQRDATVPARLAAASGHHVAAAGLGIGRVRVYTCR